MARTDREGPIQRQIVAFLRSVMPPGCIVHFCRNEISGRGKGIMLQLARAKAQGAVKGFPDLVVLTYRGALFFEVKAEGNYATPEQRQIHEQLTAMGYRVAVVRSVDDVRQSLREWSFPTNEVQA